MMGGTPWGQKNLALGGGQSVESTKAKKLQRPSSGGLLSTTGGRQQKIEGDKRGNRTLLCLLY